ncbi:hypothetical protein B7P43_G16020 [Cryptotermes secundus]|nr:hypothetical protein B7P43_G16020 [Cryptotermes secundus]
MHNYVAPERKQRQAKYLQKAHASVCGNTKNLPCVIQAVSTDAENIRDSKKDEQPSTRDKGVEMTQQDSPEEEQQQEIPLVEAARPTLKESNRGAEEEETLAGRFHDSHEAGEIYGTHTATKNYGEALETLGGIFSISENVHEDDDYSLQGPEDPSMKDEDKKLKLPVNIYTVSLKQPDNETEDTSLQHPRSKPNTGFREHDTGNKDESSQHTKSNTRSGFWEQDKDESIEHPKSKPKIALRKSDIGKKGNSTQHTK